MNYNIHTFNDFSPVYDEFKKLKEELDRQEFYIFQQDFAFQIQKVMQEYEIKECRFLFNLNSSVTLISGQRTQKLSGGYWFDVENKEKNILFTNCPKTNLTTSPQAQQRFYEQQERRAYEQQRQYDYQRQMQAQRQHNYNQNQWWNNYQPSVASGAYYNNKNNNKYGRKLSSNQEKVLHNCNFLPPNMQNKCRSEVLRLR